MLMNILLTDGSASNISNAFLTVSGVAPVHSHKFVVGLMLKSIIDLPSDVKEVSRLSTMKAEHVHSSHRKTRPVNKATDIPVKLDEV